MRDNRIYELLGPVFYLGAVALFLGSFYWAWHGLGAVIAQTPAAASPQLAAAVGLAAILVLLAKITSLGLLSLFLCAGIDRLWFAGSYPLLNSALGSICLFLAAIALVITLSEKISWVNTRLPQVIMAVLGATFLGPIALIGWVLAQLGILTRRD